MIKLSCDEATKICDKNQYKEASIWELIKLNIHLFLCKKCGLYIKQNTIMTKCLDKHHKHEKNGSTCLKEQEKEVMKEELIEKM